MFQPERCMYKIVNVETYTTQQHQIKWTTNTRKHFSHHENKQLTPRLLGHYGTYS